VSTICVLAFVYSEWFIWNLAALKTEGLIRFHSPGRLPGAVPRDIDLYSVPPDIESRRLALLSTVQAAGACTHAASQSDYMELITRYYHIIALY